MNVRSKYAEIWLNLLVALAVSLVVNFSYLLLLIVDQKGDPERPRKERLITRAEEGVLRVSPDGHGYIIYPNGDSVYTPMQRIRRLSLADGDHLEVAIMPPSHSGAHPVVHEIRTRNGQTFDYSTVFNRPSASLELTLLLLYYLMVSFLLLSTLTPLRRNYTPRRFVWRCMWCLVLAVGLYLLAPVTDWRTGRFDINFMSGRMLDYMLLLKCSFAVVVSMLYGWIYVQISKQQAMLMENEQLKNENLTTRYNMLMGQINPHFFFNSLNSLAMLVREKHDQKALTYIDQLSYTFRYIIQNGQSTLMTLDEELRFAEAYIYLFKIRYADKLFFDIDIQADIRTWLLPAFTLQPLIDNAVKHNAITTSKPLHVSIRAIDGWLEIANPKVPKLEPEPSTGIGIENLRSRWQLTTGRDIEIIDTDESFIVRLPLQNPAKHA